MAKRPSRRATGAPQETKPDWDVTKADLVAAFGADDKRLAQVLLGQLRRAHWFPEGTSFQEEIETMEGMVTSLKALAPRDASEAHLATQMVATHSAGLDCLRIASVPGQKVEVWEMGLKHAVKLMSLYVRQQEALDKHRGKGEQKITVEHVTVEAGGQAIVGHVETGAKAPDAAPRSAPKALSFHPGEPAPSTERATDAEDAEADRET
jgi:hypothetical protein